MEVLFSIYLTLSKSDSTMFLRDNNILSSFSNRSLVYVPITKLELTFFDSPLL